MILLFNLILNLVYYINIFNHLKIFKYIENQQII